jgi:polysaccharide deacetylase family protein (PEP-CTERM system associated)
VTVPHHLTVDVEEVFHSTLLTDRVPRSTWEAQPRRAPGVVGDLLEDLERSGVRATFFVLGWLAEREPAMVRAIAGAGHEVGSHSWWHRRVAELTPESFRESVRRTKETLEDLTGQAVVGFRAPSFSILPGTEWALDILLEEGYRYDSSLFPTSVHPSYGYPDAPPDPHWIERSSGRILEVPPVTLQAAGRRLPAAGGAYLRFFPYALLRSALRQAGARGHPGTVYVHPWDLDPGATRYPLPPLVRLRLYGGAGAARRRVDRLLADFSFLPIVDTMERLQPSPPR